MRAVFEESYDMAVERLVLARAFIPASLLGKYDEAWQTKRQSLRAAIAPARGRDAPTSQIEEQSVFEEWLTRVCPSGDATEVQNQWLASSEYEDWASQIKEPASASLKESDHGSI